MSALSLRKRAARINAAHRACIASAEDAIERAIEVGRWLSEAKKTVEHGEWYDWVEANCEFGRSQAARYIQAFKKSTNELGEITHETRDLEAVSGALSPPENDPEPDDDEDPDEDPPEPWSQSELTRRAAVEAGHAVTANISTDARLIAWAQENDLYVRVDRKSIWGNPFILDDDGNREEIIESYQIYLTYKPSLQYLYSTLRGKVLGCWCYPERCHGDVLIMEAHGDCTTDEPQRVGRHK